MKKKKKKNQPSPAYQFGQALGMLLILGGLASALKEVSQEKASINEEKGDLKA